MNTLGAAVGYAGRGWAVFPVHSIRDGRCSCRRPGCAHPAKHPLVGHGLLEATTDPVQVRSWWGRWPWANIAVATGAVSGLVVVDVDPRSGAAVSLARLEALVGAMPVTVTVATGGGGAHLFFAHPGGEIRNTAGRLPGLGEPFPGLDVRGDGGYVVAPPSRHASGHMYRWDGDPAGSLAAAPDWLRPLPRRVFPTGGPVRPTHGQGGSRYGLAALRAELLDVRSAPVGDRNHRLNRAAFSLGMLAAGGELDDAVAEAELLAAAADVGLGETEARASVRSGMTAGAREPRHRPSPAVCAASPRPGRTR